MEPRMNPFTAAPEMYKAMRGFDATVRRSVPATLLHLVKLRVSQINGCAYCVDMHAHEARADGETDERLFALPAWREAPYYTEAERAALALAEAATRIADRPDPVPDEVWAAAAAHHDEPALAGLVMAIAAINSWNRISVATAQVAGAHRRPAA
jgi:AhpD family alkylhydroperoxidase